MALRSNYFRGNAQLEKAAENLPALRKGSRGDGVGALQIALHDLGHPLPISIKSRVPDCKYGSETAGAVHKFQSGTYGLKPDGVAGRNTITAMDGLLHDSGKMPSMPLPTPASELPVHVRGMVNGVAQTNSMNCWAAALAMLVSWKRQQSIDELQAVTELGPQWVQMRQDNTGLAASRHEEFAVAAGLVAEPLMSIPLSEWIRLLRQRGPIWVVYGWRRFKTDGSLERTGRHAVIVYSMTGDGSPSGTVVHYLNPSGAQRQQRSFDAFVRMYEVGYEVGSGEQEGFTQLVHY
jgi:hypothetical protein